MNNAYYDRDQAQGYSQTDTANGGASPGTLCGKPFDSENARFSDTDDACEVAGG